MFDSGDKRKSLVITVAVHLLLLLVLFFYGLNYFDPPQEMGITVDFGGSSVLKSERRLPSKSIPVEQKSTLEPQKQIVKEKVITQDVEDSPVISKKKEKKLKKKNKKPSKEVLSAISSFVNSKAEQESSFKGNSTSFNRLDSGVQDHNNRAAKGNYQLGSRTPIKMPRPKYDCKEQGRVVVRILVNRQGEVLSAESGVKGTTNSAPCLLENARIAALKTTWKPNYKAPERQQGKIIYNFYIRN